MHDSTPGKLLQRGRKGGHCLLRKGTACLSALGKTNPPALLQDVLLVKGRVDAIACHTDLCAAGSFIQPAPCTAFHKSMHAWCLGLRELMESLKPCKRMITCHLPRFQTCQSLPKTNSFNTNVTQSLCFFLLSTCFGTASIFRSRVSGLCVPHCVVLFNSCNYEFNSTKFIKNYNSYYSYNSLCNSSNQV